MKVKIELFGASRDFSKKNHLEFEIQNQTSIKDFKEILSIFIDKEFKGNKNYKKIIESSAFGYCVLTPSIIEQPCSFSPIWTSVIPSLSKLTGALELLGYF